MDIVWAEENLSDWRKRVVNAEDDNDGELTIVGGRGRGVHTDGQATGFSGLRQVYTRRGTNFGDAAEIRGLWYGPNKFSSTVKPQMGFMLGVAKRHPTKWSAVVGWYDIAFGVPSILNLGVWQWDGLALELRSTNVFTPLMQQVAFTGGSRTGNTVTVTGLPSGQGGLLAGDRITVDAADNTYDGGFTIATAPTSPGTTLTWPQTAADDASSGAGTIGKVFPYMAAMRRNGSIASIKGWHPDDPEPDWADTSYAISVDLDTVGSAEDIAAIPTPDGSGESGIMQGHTSLETYVEWGALSIRQRQRTAA